MPVELNGDDVGLITSKDPDCNNPINRNFILYDQRQGEMVDGKIALGHNVSKLLTLQNDKLAIAYFDDNGGLGAGRKIMEEKWQINLNTGEFSGISIENSPIPPLFQRSSN